MTIPSVLSISVMTFNRTTVECKSGTAANIIGEWQTFNRTTVECK